MEFNLSIAFQVLLLVLRHLMSLNFVNSRERSLRGPFTKYLKKKKRGLPLGLYLVQHTRMWLTLVPKTSQLPKGLIFLRVKNLTGWKSVYSQRSWKLWTMCCLQSTKKLERRRSYKVNVRTLVIWWLRMRRKGSVRCRRKMGNRRKRISNSKEAKILFLVLGEEAGVLMFWEC